MLRQIRVPTSIDRLMHLGLDALLEPPLAFGEHLCLDVRTQIARHRIDGLVLLFNAERERWAHSATLQMLHLR